MADVEQNTEQSKLRQLAAELGMRAKQLRDSDAVRAACGSFIDEIGRRFGSPALDAARAQQIAAQLNQMLTQTITVCRTERATLHAWRNLLRRGNPTFCQLSRQELVALDVGLSYMLASLLASASTGGASMRSLATGGDTSSALVPPEDTPSQLVALLRGQSPYERLCCMYEYMLAGALSIQQKLSGGRDTNLLVVAGAVGELAMLVSELHGALPHV